MRSDFNPRMLMLAREARGLGQADIAARLKVNQGTISRMEGGVVAITQAVLEGYSRELGFPQAFFCQWEPVHGTGTEAFHQMYRRRQALPAKALKQVEAHVNIIRMHLARLLNAVESTATTGIPSLDIDDFDGRADRVAEAVRAAWRLPTGPIDNVTQLIENAGGLVVRMDFGTDLVDATSIRYANVPPLFFVNDRLLGDRLRFTLAHELAHMVMHSGVPAPTMEDEADSFAAEFLMPARDIAPSLNRIDLRKAAVLKPFWKVSMASLIYRAKTLGKLSDTQYRRLWMQMGSARIRTREPEELDVPIETPRLHKELVELHLNTLHYSPMQVAELLACSVEDFARMHRVSFGSSPTLKLVGKRA